MNKRHIEECFEDVIEAYLLAQGYVTIPKSEYDLERAFFPHVMFGFIRETQVVEVARIEALLADKTDETLLRLS